VICAETLTRGGKGFPCGDAPRSIAPVPSHDNHSPG
jgi:hypothetical protein